MKKQEAHTQNDEPEKAVVNDPEGQETLVVDDTSVAQEQAETDVSSEEAATVDVKESVEDDGQALEPEESEPESQVEPVEKHVSVQQVKHREQPEKTSAMQPVSPRKWPKIAGLAVGATAVLLLLFSAFVSQYYKGKVMPGVMVAGVGVNAQKDEQLRNFLQPKASAVKVTLQSQETTLEPTLEEIGVHIDTEATVENVLQAKRHEGLLTKVAFWKKQRVPVVSSIDAIKLTQYIETNLPALSKPPTDSQLTFNANTNQFAISDQADGEGVAIEVLQQAVLNDIQQLTSPDVAVTIEKRAPKMTKKALEPLVAPANEIIKRSITLSGAGYTFQAQPSDIAAWITPTPKEDGSVKLVVDQSKIQAYVEAVGKRISQPPQDRKVLTTATGEVVLQAGQDGTELSDREQLAKAIALAVGEKRDLSQQMNIQVAAFKTINMEAFDRWVEVDLSEQRTTLYNGTTPLQSFVISSGLPQWPTVTGEFKVWHKNATQTMTGGSRATGDYYNLPNVTWVTYFYKDYGFHTAYWHNNFGQPMSHGCVNMRESDAKILYDFAPIGTTVIVHQ